MFRDHDQFPSLLARTHRFRAIDQVGLFSLAKDVARLTADSIDVNCLQKVEAPPSGEKWGSLKSLEHVLARYCDAATARSMLEPLHGAYNLRHADAHLTSSDLSEAFELLEIDPAAPVVVQGCQLLSSCVAALYEVGRVLAPELFEQLSHHP